MTARITLGLGSNLAPKRTHLLRALAALEAAGVKLLCQSSVYASPALLPPDAPPEWDQEFLNQVVEVETDLAPEALLVLLKSIEQAHGRKNRGRWATREIDLDLLDYRGIALASPMLTLPHPGIHTRDFVLLPWQEIVPNAVRMDAIAALPRITARRWRAPTQMMGILNLTPDSFSDGKNITPEAARDAFLRLVEEGAEMVDIGAESTRPGATPVSAEEEWQRLRAPLEFIVNHPSRRRVKLSIDTRHASTAARALDCGIEIINDVSGGGDEAMRRVLARASCAVVVMHSLTIPADPCVTLPVDADPVAMLRAWKDRREGALANAGIDPSRIIFDPGIGFGKTAAQSLALLARMSELVDEGGRWLIGHSRKSFLRAVGAAEPPAARDPETLAFSRMLMDIPVDILRVHDVASHVRLRGAQCR
jgi:2-amino-4-hydroxy-6-hydroxymethyldihydropteridine diphosphokinase/dihydropteroate synthase